MKWIYLSLFLLTISACKKNEETTFPSEGPISESVYASGTLKSQDQYQAFAPVNGIIEQVFVQEGDSVKIGDPILAISHVTQQLNQENAALAANFADSKNNQSKIYDAELFIDLAKNKWRTDSTLLVRQRNLWKQQIGTQVELEQRELAYENSKAAYLSSILKLKELKRQIQFTANQSKKNLSISKQQSEDFTVKSKVNGIVYDVLKSKGEIVSPQTPLAIVGNPSQFVLQMQVDEEDIFKVKLGLPVLLTLDAYKGQVFEAKVSKIYPIMNERSKTFLVEAQFTQKPANLFPNVTFEANIILFKKEKSLLIPRNYLIKDSLVIKASGDTILVKTGLKDFKKVEILGGLSAQDEIKKPGK
ncbi:efflux RND transporter periplasmic adaptor subunit [Aquirufa sp. Wall-65K1]